MSIISGDFVVNFKLRETIIGKSINKTIPHYKFMESIVKLFSIFIGLWIKKTFDLNMLWVENVWL